MTHCNALRFKFATALFAVLVCLATPAHAQDALEDKVKSAFVFNFAKFIDWPELPANTTTDFNICIAGASSMASTLSRTLENKVIKQRNIKTRRIGWSAAQLEGCHMLYVNGDRSPKVDSLLSAAKRKPILTIGEGEHFIANGGIIQFLLVDGKVRFSINQASATHAGLNISAKLLKVSYRVISNQSELKPQYSARRHALLS